MWKFGKMTNDWHHLCTHMWTGITSDALATAYVALPSVSMGVELFLSYPVSTVQ